MPVDASRLQKAGQQKFRYMDMAEGRRSRFMREAVLLSGQQADACSEDVARESAKAAPQAPAARVIMRPMT